MFIFVITSNNNNNLMTGRKRRRNSYAEFSVFYWCYHGLCHLSFGWNNTQGFLPRNGHCAKPVLTVTRIGFAAVEKFYSSEVCFIDVAGLTSFICSTDVVQEHVSQCCSHLAAESLVFQFQILPIFPLEIINAARSGSCKLLNRCVCFLTLD